jgi:Lipocalin-like domain
MWTRDEFVCRGCVKRCLAAIVAIAAVWAGTLPAVAAENALVGTWQLTSFSLTVVETKETSRPYGENPTGYIQYSPGGHMVMFLASGELEPPASRSYTDAERAAVHRSIIGAYAGTYRVDGSTVVYHVLTSWRPEWIGHDQVRFFETNGTDLTIKTTPIAFSRTGQTIVATLTLKRVE